MLAQPVRYTLSNTIIGVLGNNFLNEIEYFMLVCVDGDVIGVSQHHIFA